MTIGDNRDHISVLLYSYLYHYCRVGVPPKELADLLLDDVPSRTIPDFLGFFMLTKLLRLRSVAMAMVADVDLVTLKAYESRFIRFASARFHSGMGFGEHTWRFRV